MTAPRCRLDHIAVTAPDLAGGARYVADFLGVELQVGGEHPTMATHNQLLRIGDAVFLEVIAPNPAAPRPGRRRWFALDEQTPATLPRLAGWIARSADVRAVAAAASEPLGELLALERNAMRWEMTVPRDGSLGLGGAVPMVLQWDASGGPASRLAEVGCRLHRLELHHPEPARVTALLASIGLADERVAVIALAASEPPHLVAQIATPRGMRRLGGSGR